MINTTKIKDRMKEMKITQSELAKFLGVASPTINQKLNNVRSLSLEEANIVAQVLEIPAQDFGNYFFSH